MRLSFPWAHAPTLVGAKSERNAAAAVLLNPLWPLPQVFVLASVQVYMTQTGTLALATLPFLGRGSVLIDLGMPTGARPTFYAAEYVYATFDHVQVCSCLHSSVLSAPRPLPARRHSRLRLRHSSKLDRSTRQPSPSDGRGRQAGIYTSMPIRAILRRVDDRGICVRATRPHTYQPRA